MPAFAYGNSKFIAPLVFTFGILTLAFFTPFAWILPFSQRQETCFIYSAFMIYRCNIRALFVPRMSVNQFQDLLKDKSRACKIIKKVEFVDDMVLGKYAEVSLKHSRYTYRVYLSKDISDRATLKLQDYDIWTYNTLRCI